MTDNTTLPIPAGSTSGDVVRDIDRTGVKTQVVQLDIGGAASEQLVVGTMPVSGSITVANASLAVTGTFWQATQPISGTVAVSGSVAVTGPLTDVQLRASAVPVSGAFFQATQPVSVATAPVLVAGAAIIGKVGIDQTTPGTTNAVSVTNASIAVTGTFFQATQPVSGTVTVGNATLAVTQSGTWNIGTVTTLPALPANQSVNVSQINGITPLMGNGITGAGSQRVTIASDNTAFGVNLAQYTAVSGRLPVDGSGVTQPVSGTFWQTTQPVSGAVSVSNLPSSQTVTNQGESDVLLQILTELKTISQLLQIGLSIRDEPADIRNDILATIQ